MINVDILLFISNRELKQEKNR